jgi:hypothetical protein
MPVRRCLQNVGNCFGRFASLFETRFVFEMRLSRSGTTSFFVRLAVPPSRTSRNMCRRFGGAAKRPRWATPRFDGCRRLPSGIYKCNIRRDLFPLASVPYFILRVRLSSKTGIQRAVRLPLFETSVQFTVHCFGSKVAHLFYSTLFLPADLGVQLAATQSPAVFTFWRNRC